MTQVLIEVTAADIERGQCLNSRECPIALAVFRKFRRYTSVEGICLEQHARLVIGKRQRLDLPLPIDAFRFANDFDSGKPVKPFSFWLKLPRKRTVTRRLSSAAARLERGK